MFVIIYPLLYFSCFVFTKPKAPPNQKQTKSHTCKTRSKSAPSENIGSAEALVLKHRAVLKFGLGYRFFPLLFSIWKIKHNKTKQSTQIQNLYNNNNNTRTSVLLQYTPKIKYPSATQGSKDMTKSPTNKAVKVNQHRQSSSSKRSSK